jgi:hypothetical protein
MKTFVLIIMIMAQNWQGGVAVTTQEFNSMKMCQDAGNWAMQQRTLMAHDVVAYCTEK